MAKKAEVERLKAFVLMTMIALEHEYDEEEKHQPQEDDTCQCNFCAGWEPFLQAALDGKAMEEVQIPEGLPLAQSIAYEFEWWQSVQERLIEEGYRS